MEHLSLDKRKVLPDICSYSLSICFCLTDHFILILLSVDQFSFRCEQLRWSFCWGPQQAPSFGGQVTPNTHERDVCS